MNSPRAGSCPSIVLRTPLRGDVGLTTVPHHITDQEGRDMGASAHDKAIAAVMKWAQREEWRDRLDTIIADHLEPALEAFDLDPDELPELLGPNAYAQLVGCAFEDFLTCDFEPDGQNIVDDYLKRRG